jgi:hypothetical protein
MMGRTSSWNVRAVALLMVAVAALAVANAPTVDACSCNQNEECSWGSGCYSPGSCCPDGSRRSCFIYSCGTNCNHCLWGADEGCP